MKNICPMLQYPQSCVDYISFFNYILILDIGWIFSQASSTESERGIIPRAIQDIFQHIAVKHNSDFTVKASYIEVYKEELRDLLELDTSSKDMHIREDEKGNTGKTSNESVSWWDGS